jgi:phosphocarrier protein
MKEFTYTINDPLGIHARPAGLLVKQASQFSSKITITKEGKEADAKKILGIMSLGVKKDHDVTIKAEGDDEDAAIEALSTFIKSNL